MEILGLIAATFLLGLGSSGHCALMCGPVQAAWLGNGTRSSNLSYFSGKFISYTAIALLFGIVANTLPLQKFTTNATMMLGISLVMGAAMYLLVEWFFPKSWSAVLLRFSSLAGRTKGSKRYFFFGLINGFLPCGMVWMAASLASASASSMFVPVLMLAFLIGTLPALFGVQFLQSLFSRITTAFGIVKMPKCALPLMVLFLGIFLTLRGYSFQNQLMSPNVAHEASIICKP
jgi:hypothetical protein